MIFAASWAISARLTACRSGLLADIDQALSDALVATVVAADHTGPAPR